MGIVLPNLTVGVEVTGGLAGIIYRPDGDGDQEDLTNAVDKVPCSAIFYRVCITESNVYHLEGDDRKEVDHTMDELK